MSSRATLLVTGTPTHLVWVNAPRGGTTQSPQPACSGTAVPREGRMPVGPALSTHRATFATLYVYRGCEFTTPLPCSRHCWGSSGLHSSKLINPDALGGIYEKSFLPFFSLLFFFTYFVDVPWGWPTLTVLFSRDLGLGTVIPKEHYTMMCHFTVFFFPYHSSLGKHTVRNL